MLLWTALTGLPDYTSSFENYFRPIMKVVKKKLSAAESRYVEGIMRQLEKRFPRLTRQEIIEGPVALHVSGSLPDWTRRKTHKLLDHTTFDASAFLICTFIDKKTLETMVVLQHQRDRKGFIRYCATGGGFQEADYTKKSKFHKAARGGEQPWQCAARETREEVCDNKGRPILDLDPDKFRLIPGAVGHERRRRGDPRLPVLHVGYRTWLKAAEVAAIKRHKRKLDSDPYYRDASFRHAKHETCGVTIMPLAKAASLLAQEFKHRQEFEAIQMLQKILKRPVRGAEGIKKTMPVPGRRAA